MPKFLRDALSYVVVAAAAVVLYAGVAPAKVAVEPPSDVTAVPVYAQKYMDAICETDAEYLAEHTHPTYATADDIASFTVAARSDNFGCAGVKYLGSYQKSDTQVFSVVVRPSGKEVFYLITFNADKLVINIE